VPSIAYHSPLRRFGFRSDAPVARHPLPPGGVGIGQFAQLRFADVALVFALPAQAEERPYQAAARRCSCFHFPWKRADALAAASLRSSASNVKTERSCPAARSTAAHRRQPLKPRRFDRTADTPDPCPCRSLAPCRIEGVERPGRVDPEPGCANSRTRRAQLRSISCRT